MARPDLTVVIAVPLNPKAIEELLRRAPQDVRAVHEPEPLAGRVDPRRSH